MSIRPFIDSIYLCLCLLWDLSPARDLQRSPQISHDKEFWERFAGTRVAAFVLSLLELSLVKIESFKAFNPSKHFDLHSGRSRAICSKLLCGMLTAVKLYFSLSLYRSHGRPTFRFPSLSWLYKSILGVLLSSILSTCPVQRSWACMRRGSMELMLQWLKRFTLEILSFRLYPHMVLRQLLWKTSSCRICSL